jgi:drug/metabolite transporter (DMT)-like permease
MTLPILLAFVAMICWGVGDFLIQKTIKKIGALETLCWTTLFSSFLLLPLVFKEIKNLTGWQFFILTVLGVVNFASGFIHFKALKIGKLSVVETILSIELPLTVLLGLIFFKESLGLIQIALIATLFIGIILISINFEKIHKRDFLEKGALLAILSGVLIALVNFLTASQAREVSPLMAIWLPWLVCGLVCFGHISRRQLHNFLGHSRDHWPLILAMVAVDLAAWLAYVFAVARAELGITIAITESFIIIALMLGVIINHEKIKLIQYVGAAMAIASSLAIGLISR